MGLIYLYETTAVDSAGTSHAIRLCTGLGYDELDGPGPFEPAIAGGAVGLSIERNAFAGFAFGGWDISAGQIEVMNTGGRFDAWLDWGFGRTATLKLGEEGAPYAGFATVVSGTATEIRAEPGKLVLGWQSRMRELDEPVTTATFTGVAEDLEGAESDKGRRKPQHDGWIIQLTPELVDPARRIYGWKWMPDGARGPTSGALGAVRFRCSGWTKDTGAPGSVAGDYPNAAALKAMLDTYSPVNGHFVTCLAESLLLMGGSVPLNGPVTIDVTVPSNLALLWPGNLLKTQLLRAGVPAASIPEAQIAAINAACPHPLRVVAHGDETFRELCDQIAAAAMVIYGEDALGRYRFKRLQAPEDAAAAAIFRRQSPDAEGAPAEGDLKACQPVTGEEWVPVKEVRVRWGRHATAVQPSDVADAVWTGTPALAAYFTAEWRVTEPAVDAGVAARYPNARSLTVDSIHATEAGAVWLRDRLLAFFGAMRRSYSAKVSFGPAQAGAVDMGDVVELIQPAQGMQAGRKHTVLGIRHRIDTRSAEIKALG